MVIQNGINDENFIIKVFWLIFCIIQTIIALLSFLFNDNVAHLCWMGFSILLILIVFTSYNVSRQFRSYFYLIGTIIYFGLLLSGIILLFLSIDFLLCFATLLYSTIVCSCLISFIVEEFVIENEE